jgi:F0F1-type ATP synthase assembly protein I
MSKKWYLLSFFWHCVFFAAIAAIVSFAYDVKSALAALLGGLAYCLPVLLVNLYVNLSTHLNSAVVRAYAGSIYRLMMAAGILVYLFKETNYPPGVIVGMFCLGAVVQYVTSFVFINREK